MVKIAVWVSVGAKPQEEVAVKSTKLGQNCSNGACKFVPTFFVCKPLTNNIFESNISRKGLPIQIQRSINRKVFFQLELHYKKAKIIKCFKWFRLYFILEVRMIFWTLNNTPKNIVLHRTNSVCEHVIFNFNF